MMMSEAMLVSAPNSAGERFIVYLLKTGIPFVALVNSRSEFNRITALGVPGVFIVDTKQDDAGMPGDVRIGKVVLFEKSFNLCCRYIQICRRWTDGPIYTVSGCGSPRMKYRSLGADHVMHLKGGAPSSPADDPLWEAICR